MGRLTGKVAIVTASTEGIGYSIAERLGKEGASVVISSRKQKNVDKRLQELKHYGINVTGCVCHVGKKQDRENLIKLALTTYGHIDIVVSNAAVNPTVGPILETSEEAWDKIFDINLKSTFLLCKEVFPHMKEKGGSIVFVSSIGGYRSSQMLGPYGVSKTAMFGLARALAPQLAECNIRVNCIAPGLIQTNFSKALWQNADVVEQTVASQPIKRIGHPDECAGAVAFLASDDASYITGETIVMAGGEYSRL